MTQNEPSQQVERKRAAAVAVVGNQAGYAEVGKPLVYVGDDYDDSERPIIASWNEPKTEIRQASHRYAVPAMGRSFSEKKDNP